MKFDSCSTTERVEKVKAIARGVGEFQAVHFRSRALGVGEEKSERELVSEIDIESERRLKEGLLSFFPGASFYGEETGRDRKGEYTWVVDPVDGTTNYLSGLDEWSISIALVRGAETRLSVIHRPWSNEFFTAAKGEGAWFNDEKLEIAAPGSLRDSLIGTGLPYRSPDTADNFFPACEEILYSSRGIRRMGSAALDLARVAAGFLQGFWEVDLKAYDVAAALLLLEETGCEYTCFDGSPYDPFQSCTLVTGRPGVFETLREITARHYGDR